MEKASTQLTTAAKIDTVHYEEDFFFFFFAGR